MKNSHKRFHPLALSGIALVIMALVMAACAPAGVANTGSTGASATSTTGSAYAMPAATAIPTAMAAPTNTSAPAAVSGTEASISVVTDAKLGKILVGNNGMTLYMFKKDEPDKSNCSAGCLKAWPPLLTQGSPKLGDGVNAALVGSTALPDGTKIVTYNKMPLYYFASDTKAGDTNGQDVGSVWYAVSPDGSVVNMGSPASVTTPTTAPAAVMGAAMVNASQTAALGSFLVDGKGMTLYRFTKDEMNKSNCTGGCLTSWPPLLSDGAPSAGKGVDAGKLGTIPTADGKKQVTYDGSPLYYFANDKNPGDTTRQNVGSVWFVVTP
jgi:predicted lipoprotein with Yx(FWY)xxD motif